MDNFPPELCANICRHVQSNIDLKSLSLSNRQWAAATRPWLFRRIHVLPWLDNVDRLERYLEQPLVRTHAKELHLHVPSIPDFPSTPSGENDLRAAIGSSFTGKEPWFVGAQARPQDHNTDSARPDSMRLFFLHRGDVGHYSQGIFKLMTGAIWEALRKAVGQPLEKIVVDAGDVWTNHAEIWSLLQKNCALPARTDNRFGMLADSMIKAGLLDGVTEVDLQRLPPETLSNAANQIVKVPTKFVEAADRVYLSYAPPCFPSDQPMAVDGSRAYQHNFIGTGTLVDHTKEALEELSVQFWTEDGPELTADIPLGPAYDCVTLQRLSLGGLNLTFGIVQGMLDNVRETLERLEFRDVRMRVFSDTVPNGDTTPRGFLCALVENHRLKEARFEDIFQMDKKKYDMTEKLEHDAFDLRHKGEEVTLGQQVARAVVLKPAHHCARETDRTACRSGQLPPKEERLNWLRATFNKLDENSAKKRGQETAGDDSEDEWEDEDEVEGEGEWEEMEDEDDESEGEEESGLRAA